MDRHKKIGQKAHASSQAWPGLRRQGILQWLALALLLAFPFIVNPFLLDLANLIALASIGALALNILIGWAGLISLGHAALLGAGAFTVGIMIEEFGAPIWITVPAAAGMGAAIGFVVGLPSVRLKGLYLAVSTLALHFIVVFLGGEYQTHHNLSTGIVIPDPALGPFVLSDRRAWFYVLVLAAAAATVFSVNLLRTRTGRAWLALRDRDIAASAIGVNLTAYKLAAFVVSAAMTSFAGALTAYYQHFVAVEAFSFFLTIQYVAMVLVGGPGSIAGAIVGAAFVIALPQGVNLAISSLSVPPQLKIYTFAVNYALFGLLMGGFLLFEPGGLVRLAVRLWGRLEALLPTATAVELRRPGRAQGPLQLKDDAMAAFTTASSTTDCLLDVAGLTVSYSGLALAVDHLSIRVPAGSIVALLGANGAGKTTTLRAISGFLPTETARITSGTIRFDGQLLDGLAPDRIARSGAVLVPERDKIFATLTVEQNLSIVPTSAPSGNRRAALREAIATYFPILQERQRQLAGYLSGGERQQLAMASALLRDPRLLLVDELSLGLAPALVQELMRLLEVLRRELALTILLVEQNAAAALNIADYAYILSTGRLVKQGPAKELLADAAVQELYLGVSASRRSYRQTAVEQRQ
ncbi:MAG: ATP-binding cassette domain-containing protein [Chloroflexi bacterium]|nr:ATP-binding cassette domain-containing protein [Chloroflexota bacterium]MDA8189854.1 ATP-binding cassette domain-containing protein [Dehalococcoidales bacterium]